MNICLTSTVNSPNINQKQMNIANLHPLHIFVTAKCSVRFDSACYVSHTKNTNNHYIRISCSSSSGSLADSHNFTGGGSPCWSPTNQNH